VRLLFGVCQGRQAVQAGNGAEDGSSPVWCEDVPEASDECECESTKDGEVIMTEISKDNFAIELTDKFDTEDQWYSVMRFGMPTLLADPPLLMECIVRRAQKRLDTTAEAEYKVVADIAQELMKCLGLKFVMKG
jgi:hypothetical protein